MAFALCSTVRTIGAAIARKIMTKGLLMTDELGGPKFPAPNPDYGMPFYYSSLTTWWVYYQVDIETLTPYVGPQFVPATIGGSGLVVINPQVYSSSFNNGQELTTETEFNIVVYPRAAAARAPLSMSLTDYLQGADQTKLIGNLRLHVACDDDLAVKAGTALFGEPKFLTTFAYDIPSPNAPGQLSWSWTINDPNVKDQTIFDLEILPLTAVPQAANPTPITGYTYLGERAIGSRWAPFGACQLFDVATPGQVSITFGESAHPMRTDMQNLVGTRAAIAVQVVTSPPVCVESGPFFVDL
ncbi:MAG: hypothetical protein RLZZ623_2531 [Actinomycetota bacterium]